MSGFISANPDDDFIPDREVQWLKYAKGMEAFRDKQAATIASLQEELARVREALADLLRGYSTARRAQGLTESELAALPMVAAARAALGGSDA